MTTRYITFKRFATHVPYLGEGITHLEDLPIDDFIDAVENLNKTIATQKLDGTNAWMGIDDADVLYLSREGKGRKERFHKLADFPDIPAFDGFRATFAVLKKREGKLRSVLKSGDVIDMEILFGRQPNSITYGRDGLCYLAFLRVVQDGNDPPDQTLIKKLYSKVKSTKTNVTTSLTDTVDGESLIKSEITTSWKFVEPENIDTKTLKSVNVKKELSELKKYLYATNEAANELTKGEVKTNYDVLKTRKTSLSAERKKVNDVVMNDFKLSIKNSLLDRLVRNVKPKISADDSGQDVGIEGVVFLNPTTQKQFKLIDKDIFTAINTFNYEVRSNIAGTVKTDDPLAPLAQKGGIFGDSMIRIGNLFNITGLSTSSNLKRTLRKFKGETPEETVANMTKSLHEMNFGATKKKVEAILIQTLKDIEASLNNFKENSDKYKLKLKSGKELSYSPEIIKRTLLVFAETKRNITELREKVNGAKRLEDIVVALFGKQIKAIGNE